MTTNSHGVLVLLCVLVGSPITMTAGNPNAGNVACRSGENWRARVEVVTDLLEFLRRILKVGKEFSVVGDEKQWCRDLAPAGPDFVVDERRQAVELDDTGGVGGRDGFRGLAEERGQQQGYGEDQSHQVLDRHRQ